MERIDTRIRLEMGKISNLITDMTLRGATVDEMTRATNYATVVIDAAKHGTNYIQSAKDNGIAALMAKYGALSRPPFAKG